MMKRSQNYITRLLTIGAIVTIMLSSVVVTSFATSHSYTTSWSFQSGYNGSAYLDGSRNGVYYTLDAADAYLDLQDAYNCAVGSYTVGLYKEGTFFNTKIGSNTFNSAPFAVHQGTYSVTSAGNRYYFYIVGTGDYNRYAASGEFFQN